MKSKKKVLSVSNSGFKTYTRYYGNVGGHKP